MKKLFEHYFRCKNCGGEISHSLLQASAVVKCPYCKKEYIAVKNIVALIVEMVILFVLAIGIRSILSFANTTIHLLLELGIVIVLLLIFNILFDLVLTRVIKWKDYMVLMERLEVAPERKKKQKTTR